VPPSSPPEPLPPGLEPLAEPPLSLVRPSRFDLRFEGFSPYAVAVLERLRAHPHIEQYQKDRDAIRAHVQEPFKRYRDDLALNWVIPNRIPFETERGVFSRILKNDFGAGGSHHHLWMSFYRTGLKRLADYQLAHSLDPDGFTVGLFTGDMHRARFKAVKERIAREPQTFLDLVRPVLAQGGWQFGIKFGSDREIVRLFDPPDAVPSEIGRSHAIWLRRTLPIAEVVEAGPQVVVWAVDQLHACWPLYLFYLGAERQAA
jgi:hypothetical protein